MLDFVAFLHVSLTSKTTKLQAAIQPVRKWKSHWMLTFLIQAYWRVLVGDVQASALHIGGC